MTATLNPMRDELKGTPSKSASVGDRVTGLLQGRYRLAQLIGSGGMARVYRAHDEFLGRDVAIKVFRSTSASTDDLQRQKDEINALATLSHHSLVTLFDVIVDGSIPDEPRIVFVMELVRGVDLRERLADGTLSPRQVALVGVDITEGLEHVHSRGIVHRDIKPANILMSMHSAADTRPYARLTDFGVALMPERSRVTAENAVTGTVAYVSPEQASGEPVGPVSDIYSLGLVLLECFTGRLEFPGAPVASAVARLMRDPVVPRDLPDDWHDLLRAMTARNPVERPQTDDLVRALRQVAVANFGRHRAPGADKAAGTAAGVAPSLGNCAEGTDVSRHPGRGNVAGGVGDSPHPGLAHAGADTSAVRATTVSSATDPDIGALSPPATALDEGGRIAAVVRYNLLDQPANGTFDRVTAIAARFFAAPIALVSIVDTDRIWFASRHGLDIPQIDRDPGLCASAILHGEPWVVEDARADPRALANPLVAGEFGLQFYAGVPLTTSDGYNLGTLCVLDFEPREATVDEIATLDDLAAIIMRELDMRLEHRRRPAEASSAPIVLPRRPLTPAG